MVALLLILGGSVALMRGEDDRTDGPNGAVVGAGGAEVASTAPRVDPNRRSADTFCTDAGYLCAGLADAPEVTLRRWVGHEGTIIVHVPLPDGEDRTTATALQRAAASGIRAWNNQPYPILIDLRGDRDPHFAVDWSSSLGGSQLGLTRTSWSRGEGLEVVAVSLGTRQPFARGTTVDPRQVRLTAAHEMGHALGLPHSDQSRDVMYPTNTATSLSARDYRSIEVLYATADGTIVTR